MSHAKLKTQNSKLKTQRGISLLFIVLIISLILAIGLGINALLIQGIRTMSEIGYSVTAFYAADSGIETALYDLYKSDFPSSSHTPDSSGPYGDISFGTIARCTRDILPEECALGSDYIDPDCDALNYCLKSAGRYKEVKRAIEIKY